MCDYSIEFYRSRPAQVGEKYAITRFHSGSVGLASPGDCSTAVCVPYETRLRLEGIPGHLQTRFGVGPREEVTFVQVEYGRYRDGVRFDNGAEVSLQKLEPGITASVARALERGAPRVRARTPVAAL
ncbi:MAG: hypothetical protein ACE5GS_15945 [Kiloniellaceae bacterium]